MGGIFSCVGGCIASCVGSAIGSCVCSICTSCCQTNTTSQGRRRSVMLLFYSVVLALIFQYILAPNITDDLQSDLDIEWEDGCDYSSETLRDKCRGNAGVYRVGSIAFLFYTIMTLVTRFKPAFNRSLWLVKFILFTLVAISSIWIPNEPLFSNLFINIARVGGFIFVLFQMIILIDLAYSWNEAWVEKSELADMVDFGSGRFWLKAILAACVLLYLTAFISLIILFDMFKGCHDNNVVLSFTFIGIVAVTTIQLMGEEGSLLTSGVVSVYCVYLAFSAVSKNPDYECNPILGEDDEIGIIIGVLLTLISIVWVGWAFTAEDRLSQEGYKTTSSRSLISARSNSSSRQFDVSLPFLEEDKAQHLLQEEHNDNNNIDEDSHDSMESDEVSTNVWKLNLVLMLVSCFYTVSLTGWGTIEEEHAQSAANPEAGNANFWIIATSQWLTFSLYAWTLVAPKLFPDRDFS